MIPDPVSGRLTSSGHELFLRVYFEDTDLTGVVYHSNYLKYFERGRTDMLRLQGVHHAGLASGVYGEALTFAAARAEIDFRRPARLDDVLRIESRLVEMIGARFIIEQKAFRDDVLLATLAITVVMITPDGRPRRIPQAIRDKLATSDKLATGDKLSGAGGANSARG